MLVLTSNPWCVLTCAVDKKKELGRYYIIIEDRQTPGNPDTSNFNFRNKPDPVRCGVINKPFQNPTHLTLLHCYAPRESRDTYPGILICMYLNVSPITRATWSSVLRNSWTGAWNLFYICWGLDSQGSSIDGDQNQKLKYLYFTARSCHC